MYKLCRIDIEHSQDLIDKIKLFTERLKEALPVREVYLFGSFVTGELHEGSDIDMLIIGDFRERLFERIGKILDLTDLPVEPFVYTTEEFEEMKNTGNPFITEILKTAVRV